MNEEEAPKRNLRDRVMPMEEAITQIVDACDTLERDFKKASLLCNVRLVDISCCLLNHFDEVMSELGGNGSVAHETSKKYLHALRDISDFLKKINAVFANNDLNYMLDRLKDSLNYDR